MTTVALFDLDETLVRGDTASEWADYVCENNMISTPDEYLASGERLYEDYLNGCLDIVRYMEHSLTAVRGYTTAQVASEVQKFIEQKVRPRIYPHAFELITKHKNEEHIIILISAAGGHIVHPLGEIFGVDAVM